MAAKRFKAVLETGGPLGWTVARVPFVPREVWRDMVRMRVRGTVNGFAFRTSLFPAAAAGLGEDKHGEHCEHGGARSERFVVLVNRAMQRSGGVAAGSVAEFVLEPDMEARPAELPEELELLLDEEDGLREFYDGLTEYTRREIGKWIAGVKSEASRQKRAEQMAERLMLTMEGDREVPPVIAAAFRRRPKAKLGWEKLTPTQRRNELMAVFYYQTPEAREKRVGKLCDLAESKA